MTLNDFLIKHSARTVKDEYISAGSKTISELKDSAYVSNLQPILEINQDSKSITDAVADSTIKFMSSNKIVVSNKKTFLNKFKELFFNKKLPIDLE